ncbi:MAG TPA: protein kinase [Thermoanaerobaculia bacterium]|nr:protein kinase [Thermoanaerobaculia bacterium]
MSEPPRQPDPDATVAGRGPSIEPGDSAGGLRSPSSPTRTHVGIDAYLSTGTILAGRYRIEGIVGIGGMGIVYRAADQQLGVPVAVKVLRTEHASDRRFRERFRRELILARQVSHRNVVRIHDLGEDGEMVFLTMDLVEGRSLREMLEREGAMPLPRAVHLVKQLARALAGAHAQGVIHRDLKPDNVLVDAHDNAFVSDFGIARSLGGVALTRTGMVVGTPNYLSPEQARGEEVDGRSDLYTLGIIFFEMLADALPFRGGSDSEVLAQRLVAPPVLSALDGKVPPHVIDVLAHLLERDPAKRYQTAQEVLADLDEFEEAQTPKTTSRGLLTGVRRRQLRRWAPRAAAVAGIAVLTISAALLLPRLRGEGAKAGAAPGKAAAAAPVTSVAVLPLVDETGRPELAWTGRGVAEMLAAELAESPKLRAVDSLRVFRTLEDLGLHGEALSGARQLATVSDLLEADRLVTGRVRSVGGGIELQARLVGSELASGGTPLDAVAPSARELPAAVRALADGIRRALAVPTTEGPAQASAGASPGASSAAMAAYGDGLDRLVKGDALGAVSALEKATAAAPKLTAAWLRLADAYQLLGRGDDASTALEHAGENLQGASPRLATEVQARRALLDGNPAEAERLLAGLVSRYPGDVELLVALATARGEGGRLDEAKAALVRATALDPKHPRAWYLLGKYAIQSGDARKALDDYLVRALVIQNQLENRQGRADVLNAMGVGAEQLGRLDEAEDNYAKAGALREQIGDKRGWATTLRNLARLATVRGRSAEAAARIAQARQLLVSLGDKRGAADLLNEIGVLEEERGHYRLALDQYRQGLQAREALGDKRSLAESYNNVGFAYFLLGEYDNASVYARQALDLYEQGGDKEGAVQARQNLGLLQLAQGRWEAAAKSLLAALDESRSLDMPDSTAAAHGSLGRLAYLQGRYGAALDSYRQALDVVRPLGDQRGLIEFSLLEAETLLALGDGPAAVKRLDQAAQWLGADGNPEQLAHLLALRGRLELQKGRFAVAADDFAKAGAAAAQSDTPVLRLEARLGGALATLGKGDAAGAAKSLAAATAEARRIGDVPLRLEADAALARAELARGRAADAAAAARDGLAAMPTGPAWGETWRLQAALADASARLGQKPAADAARAQARAELDRLRRELPAAQRQTFDALTEVRDLAVANPTG